MTTEPATRPRVGPGVAAGVTETMIRELVHGFYEKVRVDPALGPIFNRTIGNGWDAHLAKMCDFWSSVVLMSGRYKGTPMDVHAQITDIRPTHFARWLHLFDQTAHELCPPQAAALFVSKSRTIAQSLQLGIAVSRGELPPAKARIAPAPEPAPAAATTASQSNSDGAATLPHNARAYRRTEMFTEKTVPAGLLKAHCTKSGVWALIHVLEGRLAYRVCDARRPSSGSILTPQGRPGLVEPTILHEVQALGPVRFYVEFHRLEQ